MNALPLPTGPMEIPGGTLKTEKSSLNAGQYGKAEDRNSFASTLKAVHERNQTKSESCQAQTRDASETRGNNEIDDDQPVKEEDETFDGEESAQAMPAPVKQNETPPEGEEVPARPAAGKREDGVNAQTGNADHGSTRSTAGAGVQSQEAVPPKAMTTVNAQGAAKAHETEPDAAAVPKAAAESITQTPADSSQQVPGTASPPTADAANLATEDCGSADPMNETAKGLQEKKTVETIFPAQGDETGDAAPGTEVSPATGDDDDGEKGRAAMDRDAKPLPGRVDGRNGNVSNDVPKHAAHSEPQVIPAERSSTGETEPLPHASGSAGETGHETLTRMLNDANGQTVDRQVPNDPAISFTTTATTNRVESVSPGAGPATTMATATDRFHQDNFNQLVERAVFAVRGEQSEARIALKPDQLGHVQMRVVTEHHLVSIKIMTESTAARDLIDAHAHQLKTELQQQGLTVEHIEVSVSNGQGDAYRGERQLESFLRQLVSQGQSDQEEDLHLFNPAEGQQLGGQSRARGIDYFA